MPKQIAVLGLGRFGSTMAQALYRAGHDVLALDKDSARVREITGDVTYPVEGDANDERFLREVGILDYDVAVVAIGSDIQSSLLVTVLLNSLRDEEHKRRVRRQGAQAEEEERRPFIIARAQDSLHASALSRLGADKVVQIESEAGEELVHLVAMPYRLREFVDNYMSVAPDFSITKLRVPAKLVDCKLKDVRLGRARDKYGLVVMAIRRDKEIVLNPDEDEALREGDVIIVGGRAELLERLLESGEEVAAETR